jgi:hypothetical protein
MISWEYKTFETTKSMWSGKDKDDLDKILNENGRNGWELVSVASISSAGGTTTGLKFFFKRKRF